ncbi:MAG TPA: FAD:protein FMN transferase [Cyclobacteriaceae bacterium]|nr:FAD:protein FMN transferase [Cyclobacteriaceae bacterium]
MNNRVKNALYSIALVILVFVVWKYRQSNSVNEIKIEGKTMGTAYHITYYDKESRNFNAQIDSLLIVFNQSLSTYIKGSEISDFNEGNSLRFNSPFFLPVLEKSKEVEALSKGAFDPTVMPLVNAWGFGPGKKLKPDSSKIDSIMEFVGFEKIQFNRDSIWKNDVRVQLDFSAIAKGYGVDVVADYLKSMGVTDWFIEIGGEISAFGKNQKLDKTWEAAILDPSSTYENLINKAYVKLEDKAMATSGNYFNFYEENGKKYSHTINPSSGYTIQHELLSASVFADDCMTADAWATAFMVMGKDKAIKKLEQIGELDAFLIYSTENGIETFVTEGIKPMVKINP